MNQPFAKTLVAWALLSLLAARLPLEALVWLGRLDEPWRFVTAAFAHWTPWHLAMNLAGCAVLAALGWRARLGVREAMAAWLALPLTQAGLLLKPDLLSYAGLSGALHAATAAAACALLTRSGRERWVGGGIALGLAVKVGLEHPLGPALQQVAGLDFALAPFAHFSGVIAGLLAWVLVLGFHRVRMK